MRPSDNVLVKPLELQATSQVEEPLDLGQVYRQHARDVMRWATRLSGRQQEAADITQEVFCVVQRKLAAFRPNEGRLTTWLFRITEHVVRARRRKERVYRFLFGERRLPLEVPADAPTPQDAAAAASDVRAVYRALDRLSESDRTLLVLFELEGLPGEEVAELTGIKASNVWVRLHRARQRFEAQVRALEVAP
jgi:RNA polymerase sigma-70 factor, ECF subfamily